MSSSLVPVVAVRAVRCAGRHTHRDRVALAARSREGRDGLRDART